MTQYTVKERAAIKTAWDAVMYLAEGTSSDKYKLQRAEKYERKQRSCLTSARALLIQCLFNLDAEGVIKVPDPTAAELSWWSDGCAIAACIGAGWRASKGEHMGKHYPDALCKAQAATTAHGRTLGRMMDAIK